MGRLTDYYRTHCFSTHLTTFAGGFLPLPVTIDWTYVFANAQFGKNKTIYITLISLTVLYIFLIIFARRRDRHDRNKVFSLLSFSSPLLTLFV